MAKAEALSFETLQTPQTVPKAATPPRSAASAPKAAPAAASPAPVPKAPRVANEGLQLKIPPADKRAIKQAAFDRDVDVSEFLVTCFHAYMAAEKKK